MAKKICIVCGYECRDRVRPFGMLTATVSAHHHHSDREIQDAWMAKAMRESFGEAIREPEL